VVGCRAGLPEREAQCADVLALLHARLHAKRHLLNLRDDGNVVGQRMVLDVPWGQSVNVYSGRCALLVL
jgi:hypothetical protein